ncbi:uncharacterized protein LODBEIA_P25360 [Lodderomyces beijingensis]|uniref:Matrin-type domain-containing protein n=1 Tax=Lodderomyces beijingensis TaxID=1775926 RepID=A0ABP0ZQ44_9ASCO
MPKYYCDYCKSYLTHDTLSVRKSHLMGKNHIKYYCDYYEFKAKETGEWKPSELAYEMTFDKLNKGVPGGVEKSVVSSDSERRNVNGGGGDGERRKRGRDADDAMDIESRRHYGGDERDEGVKEEDEDEFWLPPPPHLAGMPLPPVAWYNHTSEHQKAVHKHTR